LAPTKRKRGVEKLFVDYFYVWSFFSEVNAHYYCVEDVYDFVVVQVCVRVPEWLSWFGSKSSREDYGIIYVSFSIEVQIA